MKSFPWIICGPASVCWARFFFCSAPGSWGRNKRVIKGQVISGPKGERRMARFLKKNKASLHRAPGSVIFVGSQKVDQARVSVMDYDQGNLQELDLKKVTDGERFKKTDSVTWINVDGVHDTDLITELGRSFDLHPLILEDIVHTGQRPKMEEYDDCLFLVVKMLRFDQDQEQVIGEQLSMVLGRTFLLTFQEQHSDSFE